MFHADTPRLRTPRSDGEQSRERLVHSALRLFALQGFQNTSTREIAEAAGTNLAAISYYFGDKAGLYRAVFTELQGVPREAVGQIARAGASLHDALAVLYRVFLEPLEQGDQASLCMKLHLRELLEPTGLWDEEIRRGIRPLHDALVAVLGRELGVRRVDDELRRLAVCLVALGVHLHVGRDVMDVLAPGLNGAPRAHILWLDRLVMYGQAMVEAERARRAAANPQRGKP